MSESFRQLPLNEALLQNLDSLEYHAMTAVQAAALPEVLAGKDIIAKAKTGSGKTVAFALGLLQPLNLRFFSPQALVLCPTRELADQVAKEIRTLARTMPNVKVLTLCGGQPLGPQLGSLEHGAHIVVGTPGRIEDLLERGKLDISKIRTLVLDEADRMLEMGFRDSLDNILAHTPPKRQTLLFSATYPDNVKALSAQFQREPISITVESRHTQSSIEQIYYQVDKDQRLDALLAVLSQQQAESCVIFCATRQDCNDVADALADAGHSVKALHGEMEQKDRDQVLVTFANHSCRILVATDVAARGLDIKELALVINYHLARDPEVHVHRIGRTGRSGHQGMAISLFSEREQNKLNAIEDYTGQKPAIEDLPGHSGESPEPATMVTLQLDGGKKQKLRPGDILGALTGDAGIPGEAIGKINVFDFSTYVAIERSYVRNAQSRISQCKIKGKSFRVRKV